MKIISKYRPVVLITLLAIFVMASAFVIESNREFKNLQVLPKDISEKRLDSIMQSYNKALGVSCDFCHAKKQDSNDLDFAADIPMKESGRRMIRLMMDINTKYFYYDSTIRPEYLNAVSCNTCHRGEPFPLGQ
ncbi:MAG: c-type cytochrome [Ferruginibacter sp.]